ncbi:hypothetical protein VTN02DRAFT_281 [Thermoascus thermophilus]
MASLGPLGRNATSGANASPHCPTRIRSYTFSPFRFSHKSQYCHPAPLYLVVNHDPSVLCLPTLGPLPFF